MHQIQARNVHCVLPTAIDLLYKSGIKRESRNGPVLVATCPVTTSYRAPKERVMFWPERDCNPFFHLMESLWMLAGRNDVKYLKQFVKRMETFSDDGQVLNGAYGFRWREHFGQDQLDIITKRLRHDPTDRRSVVAMWDAGCDLMNAEGTESSSSKDIPCNMLIQFQVSHENCLDMTVFNRSNDIIWGAYGANAVHMSVLQEYMAAAIGIEVGMYWQVSGNWHGYLETLEPLKSLADQAGDGYRVQTRLDHYASRRVKPFPLVSVPLKRWDLELQLFMEDPGAEGFEDPFFSKIAKPMFMAHTAFKSRLGEKHNIVGRCNMASEILTQMPADNDWRLAAEEWVLRRGYTARKLAVTDGGSQHANALEV